VQGSSCSECQQAYLVKDLGQHWQDGLQVCAWGDELQRHKVLQGIGRQERAYMQTSSACRHLPGSHNSGCLRGSSSWGQERVGCMANAVPLALLSTVLLHRRLITVTQAYTQELCVCTQTCARIQKRVVPPAQWPHSPCG
jgi:hypothetical protein